MAVCDVCGSDLNDIGDCPACMEANKPFYSKYLKSGEEPKLLLTIRLNLQERALLDDIKETLDINSDGTALKLGAFKGWGVLQRTFGRDFLRWLASQNRLSRKPK